MEFAKVRSHSLQVCFVSKFACCYCHQLKLRLKINIFKLIGGGVGVFRDKDVDYSFLVCLTN